MTDYAPGMRTIIRDEEWMVKKIETNSLGNKALYCIGVSPLVKDREAIFLTDLEEIQIVNPAEVKLVADHSARFRRSLIYLESQWRQKSPRILTFILVTRRLWIRCLISWILQNRRCRGLVREY